jgi:hypothetical protein
VGRFVSIYNNPGLTSLDGLNALTSVGHTLSIHDNPNLSSLTGLEKLSSVGGDLGIYNSPGLTSLNGLNALTSVRFTLSIHDNPNLSSLTGLEKLNSVGSDLGIYNSPGLTSLDGLNALTSVTNSVGIYNNLGLTSLNGLNALTSVGLTVSIHDNSNLSSLTGLEKLSSVGSDFRIYNSPGLTSLNGLNALTSVRGNLGIFDNSNLSSLTGLENLTNFTGNLGILRNVKLTTCAIASVCQYMASYASKSNISGNATGCASRAEILANCNPQPVDTEKPLTTTNGNQTVGNDAGLCTALVTVSATATDNASVGAPTGVRSDGLALDTPYPVGTTTITWNVTDENGNAAEPVEQTVTVTNAAPVINSVTASINPIAVNTAINLTVAYTDNNVTSAAINWGDGTAVQQVATPGNGFVTPHSYTAAGVYTVNVTLTDACKAASAEYEYQYVVVYDPNGGFVTGGGWINSPAGAYAADPSATGKANFGFVSKYQKGATLPTGKTDFEFKAVGIEFASTSYEWLVVAGAKAQYKGAGTLNGRSRL